MLGTGKSQFEKRRLIERTFQFKPRNYDVFTSARINICRKGDSYMIKISQGSKRIGLNMDCDYEVFRGKR